MQAWSWSKRVVVILAALGLAMMTGAAGVLAAPTAPPVRVKYYVVAAGAGGQAETVSQIAQRVLGNPDRAGEIYALNEGRTQPDGGALTAGGEPRVGWVLVLPWDAVGDGVRYGPLGEASQPLPSQRASQPASQPASHPTSQPAPSKSSQSSPAQPSSAPAGGEVDPDCPGLPASSAEQNLWAQQQLSPQDAWNATGRGSGVLVAVVDSGVDASVPQLAGRVSAGVDVVTGAGSGATDCLGTGTAMAALIVANDPRQVLGIAPEATVVPVRVAVEKETVTPAAQATAIDVAVSAGARVIALGSYVDISLAGVRQAVENATHHDVVVVIAGPVPDDGTLPPQLLRVGALGADGQLAQDYPPGSIDVLAPGRDVASLGTGDQGTIQVSGPQYAVALVAGTAALVRGASPELAAEDVAQRVRTTGTPIDTGGAAPAAGGAALISPAKAAGASIVLAPSDDAGSDATLLISVALLLLTVLGVGLALLYRRSRAIRRARVTASPAASGAVESSVGEYEDSR